MHEVHELSRIKTHPLTVARNNCPFSHPGSASEGEKGYLQRSLGCPGEDPWRRGGCRHVSACCLSDGKLNLSLNELHLGCMACGSPSN